MRWLTVRVPGDPTARSCSKSPARPPWTTPPPPRSATSSPRAPSAAGCSSPPPTPRATFETLKDRGVEITDEPIAQPYGIDFGIRDPFGNAIRIGQMFDNPDVSF